MSDIDRIELRRAADSISVDLAALAAESQAVGIKNVTALVDRWVSGAERYDRAGESMLLAWSGDRVVGVGGMAWCPDMPGALRVRRFFVSASERRRGVARQIAGAVIASGLEHTDTLSCNARASPAAPPFWESMGFEPVNVAGITHQLIRASN